MTKKICHHCVGESYLSNEIKLQGKRLKCSYCNTILKCYRISAFADRIKLAFEQHYVRTLQEPTDWQYAMLADKEFNYEWKRDGEPVVYAIMNAANVPEAAADDIHQLLANEYYDFDSALIGEEDEFAPDSYYERREVSDASWREEWNKFERSLKTEARFFSQTAAKHLASIFEGINKMCTTDNRPLVKNAGSGTDLIKLFRARVFQSREKLAEALRYPEQQLGTPPSMFATAGRMNAHGISVFYGATDPDTAIAEVRPPVGSMVAVACFEIIRPIRLLDLTALSCIDMKGSIFDPGFVEHIERITFLKNLSQHITRPVLPNDEAFEYLTTQAIADFLATETSPEIDGIIFPSVQVGAGALNIVLFHKATRVKKIELPLGTASNVIFNYEDEERWTTDCTVIEEIPSMESNGITRNDIYEDSSLDSDGRQLTLRIDVSSLCVHIVNSVKFKTEVHKVNQHRTVKDEI